MEGPYIRFEDTGAVVPLSVEVTTIGRGSGVDVRLTDPSVSRLHAEIIRRGPYAYVADLGLSRNGTRVNGRLVARRVLEDGDVLSFGAARCRIGGLAREDLSAEIELRRSASPELTRRELDVLTSLCRPALSDEAFVAPASAREIAADLVVTEAAVKQHLLRLYQKFRIPEGPNRRVRLANEVIALGLVRPLPPAERSEPPQPRGPTDGGEPPRQVRPQVPRQERPGPSQTVEGRGGGTPATGNGGDATGAATSQSSAGKPRVGQADVGQASGGQAGSPGATSPGTGSAGASTPSGGVTGRHSAAIGRGQDSAHRRAS